MFLEAFCKLFSKGKSGTICKSYPIYVVHKVPTSSPHWIHEMLAALQKDFDSGQKHSKMNYEIDTNNV